MNDQNSLNLISGEALGFADSKYELIELPSQGIPTVYNTYHSTIIK